MNIELPNGTVLSDVPDGVSKTEIMRKAVNAGLARYEDFFPAGDPTEGMSGLEKFWAGMQKSVVDTGRGIAQIFDGGKELQSRIDDAKRLDAPLLKTGAGFAGNLTGTVSQAAPLLLVPGANTVAGSMALGALQGGLQPTASDESTAGNIIAGGVLGGAGQVVGNMLPRVVGSLAAPFYESGRQRIVADALRRFATDPNAITRTATEVVPGVRYTLAEATQDPGLAMLEKAAGAADPQIGGQLKARDVQNVLASRDAIGQIAGDQAQRNAAVAARDAASGAAYQTARATTVPADPELVRLMQRPEVRAAFQQAQQNAANSGMPIATNFYTPARRVLDGLNGFRDIPEQFGNISGDTLHQVKMALDASLSSGPQRGIVGANANAVRSARDDLLNWIETRIPEYAQGRQAYAAGSRPIGQMDIGQNLYETLTPALADAGDVTLARARGEAFARALRNADATAADATGFPAATMDNIMEPAQMDTINAVRDYLARRAATGDLSAARGSDTAQNLAGRNILQSISGPLGLGDGFVSSAFAQTLARPLSLVAQPAEAAVQRRLAQALLNPQDAAQVLQGVTPSQRQALIQNLYQRALTTGSIASGAQAAGQ
jgi:hypothetical protein